jgi:cytochrome c
MRTILPSALLTFGLAASAAAQRDPEAGREVFHPCILCHAIGCGEGAPRLEGVFGRVAGSLLGVRFYTDAMRNSGIVWDADTLDRFLADPATMVPGTYMWGGKVEDAQRRRDVIAFLRLGDRSLDICPR